MTELDNLTYMDYNEYDYELKDGITYPLDDYYSDKSRLFNEDYTYGFMESLIVVFSAILPPLLIGKQFIKAAAGYDHACNKIDVSFAEISSATLSLIGYLLAGISGAVISPYILKYMSNGDVKFELPNDENLNINKKL